MDGFELRGTEKSLGPEPNMNAERNPPHVKGALLHATPIVTLYRILSLPRLVRTGGKEKKYEPARAPEEESTRTGETCMSRVPVNGKNKRRMRGSEKGEGNMRLRARREKLG